MSFEVRALRLKRGSFSLEMDFCLPAGRILVLLGPSGCGKTTLLRAIAGLEALDAGQILLDGKRIDQLPVEKRRIGFVFQDLALFEQLRVKANIAYSLSIRHESKENIEKRVASLARRFRIEPLLDRFPSALSGGERQRVALARAIASDPALVLLDEPLSALDAPLRKEMRRFLRIQLADQGISAIHVTHDAEEAADLADEIIVMRAGSMLQKGSMAEIIDSPRSGWIARFMNTGLVIDALSVSASSSLVKAQTAHGIILCRSAAGEPSTLHSNRTCVHIPYSAMVVAGVFETAWESKTAEDEPVLFARILHAVPSSPHGIRLMLALPAEDGQPGEALPFELTIPFQSLSAQAITAHSRFARITYDPDRCTLLPYDA